MIEYNFFNDHTYKTLSDHGSVISKIFLEVFLYSAATSEQQKQWWNIPPVYLRRKMNLRITGAEIVFFYFGFTLFNYNRNLGSTRLSNC